MESKSFVVRKGRQRKKQGEKLEVKNDLIILIVVMISWCIHMSNSVKLFKVSATFVHQIIPQYS